MGQISSARPPWPWCSMTLGGLFTACVAGQCKGVMCWCLGMGGTAVPQSAVQSVGAAREDGPKGWGPCHTVHLQGMAGAGTEGKEAGVQYCLLLHGLFQGLS